MKNYFYLIISLFVFLSFSCQKEESLVMEDADVDQSLIIPSKFKKEMTIIDETGKNSLFIVIYADEEKYLNDFINGNNFSLLIDKIDLEKIEKSVKSTGVNMSNYDVDNFDLTAQPKINIESITANLQENVQTYSLDIQRKKTKTPWITGYPVGYSTKRSFCGVVHKGWGYEFLTALYYKKHWYSLSWDRITVSGDNAWFLDGVQNHIHVDPGFDVHKRQITLWPHQYEPGQNYQFFEYSSQYNNYLNGSSGGSGGSGGGGEGPTPPGTEDEV